MLKLFKTLTLTIAIIVSCLNTTLVKVKPIDIILVIFDIDTEARIKDFYSTIEEIEEPSVKKMREFFVKAGVTNQKGEFVYMAKHTNLLIPKKYKEPEYYLSIGLKRIEQRTGSIKGTVTDLKGTPLENVNVECMDSSDNIIGKTKTEFDGTYLFKDINPGEYKIIVKQEKFTKIHKVTVCPAVPNRPKIKIIKEVAQERIYSSVYLQWDKVNNASGYLVTIKGIDKTNILKSNSLTITNLEPDASYIFQLRAFNDSGRSDIFESEPFRIKSIPPLPPEEVRVITRKNHRIELQWKNEILEKNLSGYYIKYFIPWEKDRYFITDFGQNIQLKKPELVFNPEVKLENATYNISGLIFDKNNKQKYIIDDGVPYNFEIFSVNREGQQSKKPALLTNVVSADTIAPLPPQNFKVIGTDGTKITFSWSRSEWVEDFMYGEKLIYRIYFGRTTNRFSSFIEVKNFPLTNEIFYIHNFENLIKPGEYNFTATAVDEFGNESVYPQASENALVESEKSTIVDITLEKEEKIKWTVKPPPSYYYINWEDLVKLNFIIPEGKTCELSGGKFHLSKPIIVSKNAKLIIKDNAVFISKYKKKKTGIIFKTRSNGIIDRSSFENFIYAIKLKGKNNITIKNSSFKKCSIAVFASNSVVTIKNTKLSYCTDGLILKKCNASIRNCNLYNNRTGLKILNSTAKVINNRIENNRNDGIYIIGCRRKTLIEKNMIFKNGGNGMKLYNSTPLVRYNKIGQNSRIGIYCLKNSNPLIVSCTIENNREYAISGGGVVENCFIRANNGNFEVDNTPDNGKRDFLFNSSSNTMIKQIFNVDIISGLKLKK